MSKIVKSFPAVIVAIDEKTGIVDAIVAVIGNIDDGDDIIHPGSFTKTISERFRRIRVLDQHRTDSVLRVVGKPLEMRELGRNELPQKLLDEYPDAQGGLWTSTQYLINTPEGKGVFDRIDADAVNEYSIGFDAMNTDYSKVTGVDGKQKTVRNIRTIKLWEYSVVIWGMNSATTTVSVKEYTPDGPQQQIGDVVIGVAHLALIDQAGYYLRKGYITAEEYLLFNSVATSVIEMIQTQIPEDVRLRFIVCDYMDWFFFSGAGGEENNAVSAVVKGAEMLKAGAVLSTQNATRIKEAFEALRDVLDNAGLLDENPAADTDSKSNEQTGPDAEDGEPSISITDDSDDGAMLALEIQRQLIEIELEV